MKQSEISGWFKSTMAVAAVLAAGAAHGESTVQLLVPPTVSAGDIFSVAIVGTNFVPIVGGGLDMSFSAGALELLSVQIDPSWNFMPDAGAIDNSLGTLTGLSFNVFPEEMSGDFTIATLQFQAIQPGAASFDMTASDLWSFAAVDLTVPEVRFVGASMHIASPVPEPEAWLLLMAGLGLLACRVGRRSA